MPLASQGSADSTLTSASFLGPFAGSPGTPSAAGEAPAAATPGDLLPSSAGSDTPSLASEDGTPVPAARRCGAVPAGEHMLPLQHLLMSDRAQNLTALEVKAIVYKVGGCGRGLKVTATARRNVWVASRPPSAAAVGWPCEASNSKSEQPAGRPCCPHAPRGRGLCPAGRFCGLAPQIPPPPPWRPACQVAADLAELHDAGILHRHVTIASVALARSGNLATARLMGHPYNVSAGRG